jgi:hypothetical protein
VRRKKRTEIWVNESIDLIIQHEYYRELLANQGATRDVEGDAEEAARGEEKVFE